MKLNRPTSWPHTRIHSAPQMCVSLLSATPSLSPLFVLVPGGYWLELLHPCPVQQVEEADGEEVVVVGEEEEEGEGGLGEEG